jgi:quercetin dioxygenase-like cupin family protein
MSHSTPPDDDASMVTLQQLLAEALKPVDFDSARSDALRSRLLARARTSLIARARHTIVRRDDDRWARVVDGVRVKLLNEDTGTRSVLVEFDAGSALPMHRHHEHEQCLVLRGDLQMDDLDIRAGDYHEAPAGSRHGRVSSTGGALIYLRGVSLGDTRSVVRDMLTAWLPGRGGMPRTIRAGEGAWSDMAPGVQLKRLFEGNTENSMLLRLQPGARIAPDQGGFPGECLLIEGEAFVGDTLLRAGEYDCASDEADACELSSDIGALFYLHSRRTCLPFAPSS